jgi:hypothetical protein
VIDVAEMMSDPDFVEAITIRRPTVTLDAEGESSAAYQDIPAIAGVQPAGQDEVRMVPEGIRIDDAIAVWSATEMRAGGDGVDSDTIVWKGKSYRVVAREPWMGNGYCMVVAAGNTP